MMRNKSCLLAVLLLALLTLAVRAPAETIRLKSGRVLLGKVMDPDERGFNFRRFDNGGVVPIEWRHLMPGDIRRLQQKFGLFEDTSKEILVKAQRFTQRLPSGHKKDHVGKVVRYTADSIIIRYRGIELTIRKDQLIPPVADVYVPALEIFTPDEYYQHLVGEILTGGEEDPERQEKLARNLMGAGVYERAQEHFTKVLELAPEYKNKGAVQRNLQQLAAAIKFKGVADLMKKVDQAKAVRNYTKALEIAAELDVKLETEQDIPKHLRDMWITRKDKLDTERHHWLVTRVSKGIYDWVRREAALKAIDKEFDPEVAREYAEKEMAEIILEKVGNRVKIEGDEVRKLWDEREKVRGCVFYQRSSYGDGTFILPKEKAHAGTTLEGQSGAGSKGGKGRSRAEQLEARVKEFLKQRMAKRGGKKGGDEEQELETPEGWWKKARINERKGWLMAYFAEFGGLMKVKKVTVDPCKNCGGSGKIPVLVNGKESFQTCPACHGHRIRRRIQFY